MVGVARAYGTDFQKHIQYILFVFNKFDHHAQCSTFEGSQLGYFPVGQLIFQHEAFSLSFGVLS